MSLGSEFCASWDSWWTHEQHIALGEQRFRHSPDSADYLAAFKLVTDISDIVQHYLSGLTHRHQRDPPNNACGTIY
jgi:hypothetical protein